MLKTAHSLEVVHDRLKSLSSPGRQAIEPLMSTLGRVYSFDIPVEEVLKATLSNPRVEREMNENFLLARLNAESRGI